MKGLGFVEDRQSVNMGRQLNLSRKKKQNYHSLFSSFPTGGKLIYVNQFKFTTAENQIISTEMVAYIKWTETR